MSDGNRCTPHGVRDCMLCRVKNPKPPVQAPEMDAQQKEAAARIADTAPVEVDFGSYVAGSIDDSEVIEATLGEPSDHAKAAVIRYQEQVRPSNPIVDAAAAYTSAQERVDTYIGEVMKIQDELTATKVLLEEAKADRDTKKTVLQALVGGAS